MENKKPIIEFPSGDVFAPPEKIQKNSDKHADGEKSKAEKIKELVVSASNMIVDPEDANSLYDPPVVDGLLREGEVGILAGAAKAKKTFLTMDLVRCVSIGDDFLGAFPCRSGRVLIVDMELPENALRARLSRMLDGESAENVDVLSLRTNPELSEIACIETILADGDYRLCVIDCLYALADAPDDENDNARMGDAIRRVQGAASRTKTACLLVHHTGKGGGAGRDLVDRGRGASAQAGVVDAYWSIMRDGDGENMQFESVARNFADPDPRIRVIEFATDEHPWRFIDTGNAPASKPGPKPKLEDADVLSVLSDGEATMDGIAARLEMAGVRTSKTSIRRVLDSLESSGTIARKSKQREDGGRGPKMIVVFTLSGSTPN